MDGSNPFTKIKWNKYKNPFRVKLFIFCMLAIPVFCFLVYGVYANFGGLIMSFEGLSREQEKVIPVGFANYKKIFQPVSKVRLRAHDRGVFRIFCGGHVHFPSHFHSGRFFPL